MAAMGKGGHESADYSRMGDVESVRAVELVCAGRLLRMGCDPFLMSVCGFVGGGETLWEQNGLPWEHSAEKRWEGGEAETERLILLGERGGGCWEWRGRDRKPDFVACSARFLSGWVVGGVSH